MNAEELNMNLKSLKKVSKRSSDLTRLTCDLTWI